MEVARLGVQVRDRRVPGPRGVVHLVVDQAAAGHLHAKQELQLPAGLVEHVRDAVAGLGDAQQAVARPLPVVLPVRALVEVHELPGGEGAVHDVFAMVARVVPASAHVQRVVAGAGQARDAGVALVGGDAEVPGRPGVGVADVCGLDRDAAAVVVEVRQRVSAQPVVQVVGDVERQADLVADRERVAGARLADGREVGHVDMVAGHRVGAVDPGAALGHGGAARVEQAPVQRLRPGVDDRGALGP
ncbi:hypothetical protein Q9G87_03040 [Nonomuraea sp. G32]|nr:hypothetical protein [Nonomuraea sp. G32]MDP4500925.1 hypothetical protein [Nonomuraea sp. G32]